MSGPSIGQVLWRRRYIILAVVAAFLIVGGAVSVALPKTYSATATVFLDTARNSPDFDLGLASSELLSHDFIVLAGKAPVLLEACSAPDVHCTPAELADPSGTLAKRIHVATLQGTSLLAVTADAPGGQDSAALANAVANAMLDQDKTEVTRLFKSSNDALDTQLGQLQSQMAAEQQALQNAKTPAAIASHQATLSLLSSQYTALQARKQDLSNLRDRFMRVATIIQPATVPGKPSTPNPPRYLAAAFLAGLVIGGLLALIIDRLDGRLYDAEALAEATRGPVMAISRGNLAKGVLAQYSYTVAHSTLAAQHPKARSILVTGITANDRSDSVAAGLADAAEESGQRVYVMHANGSAPPAVLSGTSPEVGKGTALSLPPESYSRILAHALDEARGAYDFAIVQATSPETSPSAIVLGRSVDHTVLVATAGATPFRKAKLVADMIRMAGGNIALSLLVDRSALKRSTK
jgi:capsular polysaccharide biosynthesis protein